MRDGTEPNNKGVSKSSLILTCGAAMFGALPVSAGSSFEARSNDAVTRKPPIEPAAKVLEESNLQ
jgi:hypothetical protein